MGNWKKRTAGALCLWAGVLLGCDSKEEKEIPPAAAEITQQAEKAPPGNEPKARAPKEVRKEGSLRLVVVGPGEPLDSEKAQIEEMKGSLVKAKLELDSGPPSDDERKAMESLVSERPAEVSSWAKYETVVVLQLVKPDGTEKGKRLSRGRGHLFILHPPEKEPVFSTIYETNEKGAWLEGGKLGVWVATHLRYRKGDEDEAPAPEKHRPVATAEEKE